MVRAEADARIGGVFNFTERRGDADAEHIGEYLEIDRPRRLVFTFNTERGSTDVGPGDDRHTALLGGCESTLTHEMNAKWAEYRDRTQAGWTTILEGLGKVLSA
jgi:uncharacterized protein YndB with AHSA1/START domain